MVGAIFWKSLDVQPGVVYVQECGVRKIPASFLGHIPSL